MQRLILSTLICCIFFNTQNAYANPQDQELIKSINQLKDIVSSLQKTVSAQQEKISQLENKLEQSTETSIKSAATQASNNSVKVLETNNSNSPKKGTYLPEIGLVADIVGTASRNNKEDAEGNDRFSARDIELVLGHDIDPYSRLDATITFSDAEDPAVEEAYASFWDLPFDTKLRFGRVKPKFGLAPAAHRDTLDTVDEPLVVQNYFGAEGLSLTGADLTGFTPLSRENFTQEMTLGILEGGGGEDGQLFLNDPSRIPTIYSRIKNSLDLSEMTQAVLGLNWINGSAGPNAAREVNTFGIDATVSHFLTPRNKLKFQNEFYINHDTTTWGYYSLFDYRFAERYAGGVRWDWLEPINLEDGAVRDYQQAVNPYLTFFQSEFARWRIEYQHLWLTDGTDDRFYLQGTFAIGTHKHALQ